MVLSRPICKGEDGILDDVFERFTDRARRVLTLAQEEARQLNHSFIGTEHILLGLIHEGDGVGAQALRSLGISSQVVRDKVQEIVGTAGTVADGSPPFTPRAKKVLELALREALQLNHSYIGTEHILLGLVREGEGVAATVLVSLGADLPRVRQEVNSLMSGGQEAAAGRRSADPDDAPGRSSPSGEPRCPRCSRSVAEAARFRTIVVPSDEGNADPLSIHVVYCMHCGTALHMFAADVPS
jgi:ATP-dependent Clp protease ATP-binding subunit ClpC